MRSLNIKYIPELDQLRGIAALLVVYFHGVAGYYLGLQDGVVPAVRGPLQAILLNGFTGVALFFVISGFLFTWGALQTERLNWRQFYTNRALRILPLYLLMIFVAFSLSRGNFAFGELVQDLVGLANLRKNQSDFDVVIWTIAVELQFYLLFPMLLALLKRKGPRLLVGLIGVMLMIRLLAYAAEQSLHDAVYYTMLGRLDQFLIGMLLAWLVYRRGWLRAGHERLLRTWPLVLGLVATAGVMTGVFWLYTRWGWKMSETIMNVGWPTLEAALWAVFGVLYVALARRLPRWVLRPIQLVGLVSYSLYLLHWPVMKALHARGLIWEWPGHPLASGLLSTTFELVPVALLAATLTYFVIEKPPLELRRRYVTPPHTAPPA